MKRTTIQFASVGLAPIKYFSLLEIGILKHLKLLQGLATNRYYISRKAMTQTLHSLELEKSDICTSCSTTGAYGGSNSD